MAADATMNATSFANFNADLFDRMRTLNRSWLERLREIHQFEVEFGARLLSANNQADATAICHEWMARRLQTIASEQQTFTTAWLGLVSETVDKRRPAGVAAAESSPKSQ